ncbi:MAG: Lsr2 family protein [Renibacterium salmoninarum]|nr:Lsr2 family protein [Renibacterium salmoninarum]
MAKEVITRLIDDIDGSDATQTIQYAFQGRSYEIDLNEKNAAAFTKALSPYIEKSQRTDQPKKPSAGAFKERNKRLRTWASKKGIDVPARGKIAFALVEQYEAETDDIVR